MSTDYFTQHGAARLAGRIRMFWEQRGYHPNVWTERESEGRRGAPEYYVVRSDIDVHRAVS